MQAFIGVSRKKSSLSLEEGSKSFWCIRPSYAAEVGDILLLYFTGIGIAQIYRIVVSNDPRQEGECSVRGLQTIRTVLTAHIPNPITARQMKADPGTKGMSAAYRNFQGTIFATKPEEWSALLRLIQDDNPDLELDLAE